MKLYTYDPAPNPKRLQLFIDYKGIEVETEQVDLMQLQQMSEAFGAVNPARTVPALVTDDGHLLTEVIGACVYLEALYPEKPLLGQSPIERAEVISWDHRIFNTCLMAVAEILRNANPNFAGRALPGPLEIAQIPALAERGRLRLGPSFRAVNAALEGKPFLVGDSVTLADIDLLVCTEFAGWVKESVPEDCANIHAWLPRVKDALGQ
ncbi:glutathione S-transferase family protein [Parahaliea mediterranea]|uniref:glutathione S-transferase family protein n=1 Tax=Parahaliea mediterranea TaxID=651086 RepID=UPI000E2FA17D|nr:glutathione S-transferase family protein [Parahaliea mediterranea]